MIASTRKVRTLGAAVFFITWCFFYLTPLRLYVTIDYSVVSDYCTIESYCGGDLPLTECLLGA